MIRFYKRVSTEEQGESGLGLTAQSRALNARYGGGGEEWEHVSYSDIASAKDLDRPGLERLMADLRLGDTLAVSKLDRLTRSIGDFAELLERAKRGGWFIVALDLGVDTSTPTGELVANIMVAVSQWERKIIGQRTREALAEKRANGQTLGRPASVCSEIALQITEMSEAGMSVRDIVEKLEADGVSAPNGGTRWHPSTVRRILARETA